MAQNRRPEAEERDGSSSEEGEEESSEEIEESESESEEEKEEKDKAPAPSVKKPLPSPLKKPGATQASTHRKTSSPLTRSKLSLVTPVAKSTKRPVESETNNQRESRRAKKRPVEDAAAEEDTAKKTRDDPKKQLFQRLWSEDDEIAILKGMIEYKAKKGTDPVTEMNGFHDFIKKSLHVDGSKVQLSDKVRRLRKKFENNVKKAKKRGMDRAFSNAHEQLVYEWSKKIWGSGGDVKLDGKGNNKSQTEKKPPSKDDGPAAPKEGTKVAVGLLNSVEPRLVQSRSSIFCKSGLDEDIVKDGLELIGDSKRVELEEKWSKLRIQKIELYAKQLDLIQEQTKLVLEALKSSGN